MATITLSFTGQAYYKADLIADHHLLFVGVRCRIAGQLPAVHALLDTGAQWCVIQADLAQALGYDARPDPQVDSLHTRFGRFPGRLERIPLVFEADEGEKLEMEATWFIADGWPGPIVIGWKGCLERMRFALDPSEDAFYFSGF
jgi:hypothetical protein